MTKRVTARRPETVSDPDPGANDGRPLLSVEGLRVSFAGDQGPVSVVEDVTFQVGRGEVVGLVGESGCGKSVTAMSLIRLLPSPPSRIDGGRVRLDGRNLLELDERAMCALRGDRVGVIFQEPMTSLNPTFTVGSQLIEALRLHRDMSKDEARRQATEMLHEVGVGASDRRMRQYPHELSGGLRQRIMIAMALICRPGLLIADEPTTALDVTIQAQILDLLLALQRELGMAILLITHDLGVVAETCQRVVVMYSGRIVETADVHELFRQPRHPYTHGLLASMIRLGSNGARLATIPGAVPNPDSRPQGCYFADRCPRKQGRCDVEYPPFAAVGNHRYACWNPIP